MLYIVNSESQFSMKKMRAKKTDTEIRQDQIAVTALDLIAKEGIQALSIAAIASRVGIVPSAIYRHFKSKDDILGAVLNHLHDRLLRNVEIVRRETGDSLERLWSLLMLHAQLLAENKAIPHVVFSSGIHTGHPDHKAKVRDIVSHYLGKVQMIVWEGQRNGAIRGDIEAETVSLMFLGLILPAVVARSVSGDRFDVLKHAEKAWPAFRRSIVAAE